MSQKHSWFFTTLWLTLTAAVAAAADGGIKITEQEDRLRATSAAQHGS